MKFENTHVYNMESALRGMRFPMQSEDKSDSGYSGTEYIIGENDLALAQKLIKSGSTHRKFMRQILVSVEITAPLYLWKELDQYKIGTVTNSESTMHTLATTPITLDCFETDDYDPSLIIGKKDLGDDREPQDEPIEWCSYCIIAFLEKLRLTYLSTRDKRYWKELIRWLPESWLQKRAVTINYETLFAICSKDQRRYHKLTEWSESFINWARSLPYAQEFLFIDEVQND